MQVAAKSSEWQTERPPGQQAAPGSRWHHAIQWEVPHFGREIARRSLHPMHHNLNIRHAHNGLAPSSPRLHDTVTGQRANSALVPMSSCQSCLGQYIHVCNFARLMQLCMDGELTDARDARVEGPARDGIQNQPSFNKPSSATFDSALHRKHWTCSPASACSRT